jgi:DNA primase
MSLEITAGRRTVQVSRPDKELFPSGVTKGDLARHYERVATVMLPRIADRPLTLERYPEGIEGHRIMQQRAGSGLYHAPRLAQPPRPARASRSPDHRSRPER